ncbi:cysteine hydrolase family protein [Candidatus Bipolaricaulota bacterium]
MKARNMWVLLSIMMTLVASSGVAYGCGTALLVIDMQNFVFNPLSPFYTVTEAELILAVEQLLILAREAGLQIIYIRDVTQDAPQLDPVRFEVVEELAPQEGDAVFTKVDVSAFGNDGLEEYLKSEGIRRLLLSGLSSEGAILYTLSEGRREGYDMLVVKDAHSAGRDVMIAKQYNNIWRSRGIGVEMMADIDWAAFHCGGSS